MVRPSKKSSGLKTAILFLPIIAIVALIWLILLRLDYIPENLTMNLTVESWVNLWLVILILIILILVCIPQVGDSRPKEEYVPKKRARGSRIDEIVDDLESEVPRKKPAEKPVEFVPLSKSGAKPSAKDIVTASELKPEAMKDTGTEPEEKVKDKEKEDLKSADIVARPVSIDKMKPRVIEYPLEVEGGLYGDTFIELGDETVLKLRTMVVRDIYIM